MVNIDTCLMVHGNHGICYIQDCFSALKSLPNQSFALCLTDLPYNILTTKVRNYRNRPVLKREIEEYDNNIPNYPQFCRDFFTEATRIAKMVVFTCGVQNLESWLSMYPKTFKIIIWYIRNYNEHGDISTFRAYEPLLCYNVPSRSFSFDCWDILIHSGNNAKRKYKHPHPKPVELYDKIMEDLAPDSVVDPFIGSGTTAESAEKHAYIVKKWRGYEKNPRYVSDIEMRIKDGIEGYDQYCKTPHLQQKLQFLVKKK